MLFQSPWLLHLAWTFYCHRPLLRPVPLLSACPSTPLLKLFPPPMSAHRHRGWTASWKECCPHSWGSVPSLVNTVTMGRSPRDGKPPGYQVICHLDAHLRVPGFVPAASWVSSLEHLWRELQGSFAIPLPHIFTSVLWGFQKALPPFPHLGSYLVQVPGHSVLTAKPSEILPHCYIVYVTCAILCAWLI